VGLNFRWDTALRDFQTQLEPGVSQTEVAFHHASREDPFGSKGLERLEPTKKDNLMISEISRAASLTELTSNPKSFFNCPDLHGGVPSLPGGRFRSGEIRLLDAASKLKALQKSMRPRHAKNAEEKPSSPVVGTLRGGLMG
jgi:hypothetical protein